MILDHLAYDFGILAPDFFIVSSAPTWLADLSAWSEQYWYEAWRLNFRYVIIVLFFLLVGLSSTLSRNSLKRGMLIFGFGCVISIFAYLGATVFETNMFIFFGIISCLGLSLIVYSLLRKLVVLLTGSARVWKWFALFLALLFMACGYWMRSEIATISLNSENWWLVINGRYTPTIPTHGYVMNEFTPFDYDFATKLDIILGRSWYGVDFAGLFPYLGYAFLGGFIGELLYVNKQSLIFKSANLQEHIVEKIFRPLTYIGSKTIYIYLLHQLVLGLFAFLIFYSCGTPLR